MGSESALFEERKRAREESILKDGWMERCVSTDAGPLLPLLSHLGAVLLLLGLLSVAC